MSIREQLDALHEAATDGPVHKVPDAYEVNWELQNEAGEVLGTAEGHIQYGWDENADWLEAIHNAWPEVSKQLAALERVRELHQPMRPTGNLVTADSPNYCGGDHGGNPPLHVDCKTVRALDVTP